MTHAPSDENNRDIVANNDIRPSANEQGRHTNEENPDVIQSRASNPAQSVWVGASAGSGKTKVLVDRLLRLMLPNAEGMGATAPHRILCLTFTKAGANEMALRINAVLGRWAVLDDTLLEKELSALLDITPSSAQMIAARHLFARILDTPGGMKITTIHGFCQSVLARFPLEAGLIPNFEAIEEDKASALMNAARDSVLTVMRSHPDHPLAPIMARLLHTQQEDVFTKDLSSLISERLCLRALEDTKEEWDTILASQLDITAGATETEILREACDDKNIDIQGLREACKCMAAQKTKGAQQAAIHIQDWLESPSALRIATFNDYACGAYLTASGSIRARLTNKDIDTNHPQIADIVHAEAERVLNVTDHIMRAKLYQNTLDLLQIGSAVADKYHALKRTHNVLDYDDLILFTLTLLQKQDITPWVMYKLDGGIDHILVDESQDTNPEQWEIIRILCDEFFSGLSAAEDRQLNNEGPINRTLFVVGDEKQSIYSFQRAAPHLFHKMRAYFKEKIENAGKIFKNERINTSFRSVSCVLDLVDAVFSNENVSKGLGEDLLPHYSHRTRAKKHGGLCELWPLFENDEDNKKQTEFEPWSLPTQIEDKPSAQNSLANYIANRIEDWLKNGEILESENRPIEPRDIIILMRSRSDLMTQITRALRLRGIPISGLDRMVLSDQLPVMDLLSCARFALLPDDDLSLACLLKSPLIGLNEQDLFDIAIDRPASLWQAVKNKAPDHITSYLKSLIKAGSTLKPYEFFSFITQSPCPASALYTEEDSAIKTGLYCLQRRLGNDIFDPIEEFLGQSLQFETDHTPSLQGFVIWHDQSSHSIKREMEEATDEVRIMTVHGSKGLQAPIVILPDTVPSKNRQRDRLLWPDVKSPDPRAMPLWAANKDAQAKPYMDLRGHYDDDNTEEYRRLLYVAMTRAEDRLYIGGALKSGKLPDDSWYRYVEQSFYIMKDVQSIPIEGKSNIVAIKDGAVIRKIYTPHTATDIAEKNADTDTKTQGKIAIPPYLLTPAPKEQDPPRPLIPSRPSEPEPAMRSPLASTQDYRFKRGNLTHALLQLIPDIPASRRSHTIRTYLARPSNALPEHLQDSITSEVLDIVNNPEYALLFGASSMAEVPITGLIDNKLVTGQIDRLYVDDRRVMIVDYKSNRPSPRDPADIPAQYIKQMRSYKKAITAIYPDRPIKTYLLWTDTAIMMEVGSDS